MSDEPLQAAYESLRAMAAGQWHTRAGGSGRAAPPNLHRFRDLTLLPHIGDVHLVIACDSNASIGEKPNDALAVPYDQQGVSVLKVALMELLATGALPLAIINTLCMEMEPSGRRLIRSMRDELLRGGFDPDLMLSGSTEDNMPTTRSGIGLTVVGLATGERLRLGTSAPGDALFCAGVPKDGVTHPYTERNGEIASIRTVLALDTVGGIHEILPVGSKGVLHEANELARSIGQAFRLAGDPLPIDIHTPAGTSTAVLVSAPAAHQARIADAVTVPVCRIGDITE